MDWTNLLGGALDNVFNLIPVDMVYSFTQGVKFSWGEDVKLLTHKNGMRKPPFVSIRKNEDGKYRLGLTRRTGVHWRLPFVHSTEIESTARQVVECDLQDLTTRGYLDEEENYIAGDPVSVKLSMGYRIINTRQYWVELQNHSESLENIGMGIMGDKIRGYTTRELHEALITLGMNQSEDDEDDEDDEMDKRLLDLSETSVISDAGLNEEIRRLHENRHLPRTSSHDLDAYHDSLDDVILYCEEIGHPFDMVKEGRRRLKYSTFALDLLHSLRKEVLPYGVLVEDVFIPRDSQVKTIRMIGGDGDSYYEDDDEEVA